MTTPRQFLKRTVPCKLIKTAVISGPDQSDTKEVSNSDNTKTVPEEDSAM